MSAHSPHQHGINRWSTIRISYLGDITVPSHAPLGVIPNIKMLPGIFTTGLFFSLTPATRNVSPALAFRFMLVVEMPPDNEKSFCA